MKPLPGLNPYFVSGPRNRQGETLLAAVRAFVAISHHSRQDIRIFESLISGLLPTASVEERLEVAEQLCDHDSVPKSLLDALMADEPVVADVVVARMPHLSAQTARNLAENGAISTRSVLARRADLDTATITSLIENGDYAICTDLTRHAEGELDEEVIRRLLALGADYPPLAEALADRAEVPDEALIPLFLQLGKRGRRRVIAELELMALKGLVHRRHPAGPQHSEPPDLFALEMALAAAGNDDLSLLTDWLAVTLGLVLPVVESLLTDRGLEGLALALRASGLSSEDARPVLAHAAALHGEKKTDETNGESDGLERLLKLYDGLSRRAAELMVEFWKGPYARHNGQRHRPLYQPGNFGLGQRGSASGSDLGARQNKTVARISRF